MGILYLVIAAILGTSALLVFVSNATNLSLFMAFIFATLLWSPTNWFYTKAQNLIKSTATALIIFSITGTLSDTIGGLVFQKTPVLNILFLILGLTIGIFVILIGSKSKEVDEVKPSRETLFYIISFVGMVVAILLKDKWYVLVGIYGITDLLGAVLIIRFMKFVKENVKYKSIYEYIIGIISFAPITLIVVLLLKTLNTIAIVGPSATIISCGIAMVGTKWLTDKKIKLYDIAFLSLAIVCVILIYKSY